MEYRHETNKYRNLKYEIDEMEEDFCIKGRGEFRAYLTRHEALSLAAWITKTYKELDGTNEF